MKNLTLILLLNLFLTSVFGQSSMISPETIRAINTQDTAAVYGKSTLGKGVVGVSDNKAGVTGVSDINFGVVGVSTNNFAGVFKDKVSIYKVLKVGDKISINHNGDYADAFDPNAVLHIKGDNSGWNSHIRLESYLSTTNYGSIIYDNQGLKFRSINDNPSNSGFYFNNTANETKAFISESGNLQIDGKLTSNGKGNVISGNSMQKVIYTTTAPISETLSGHSTTETPILSLGTTFTSPPIVTVAQITSQFGQWQQIVVSPFEVTTSTFKLNIINTGNNTVTFSGTWVIQIIGEQ